MAEDDAVVVFLDFHGLLDRLLPTLFPRVLSLLSRSEAFCGSRGQGRRRSTIRYIPDLGMIQHLVICHIDLMHLGSVQLFIHRLGTKLLHQSLFAMRTQDEPSDVSAPPDLPRDRTELSSLSMAIELNGIGIRELQRGRLAWYIATAETNQMYARISIGSTGACACAYSEAAAVVGGGIFIFDAEDVRRCHCPLGRRRSAQQRMRRGRERCVRVGAVPCSGRDPDPFRPREPRLVYHLGAGAGDMMGSRFIEDCEIRSCLCTLESSAT